MPFLVSRHQSSVNSTYFPKKLDWYSYFLIKFGLYKYKSGDTVDIKFIRDNKEYSTKLKLG